MRHHRQRARFALPKIRLVLLAVLTLAFGVYPSPRVAAEDPPPPPPPPVDVHQEGSTVSVPRPTELLPKERGPAQQHVLDIDNIGLTVPNIDALGALQLPDLIPPLTLEPPLDLEGLVGDLKGKLPPLDLSTVREPLNNVLGTVGQLVDEVQATATAISGGLYSATTRQQARAASPTAPSVEFKLTVTSSTSTYTYTIPLCTPTAINVVTPFALPPTTTVSLCPVPMALTTAVLVPPPGQPFQLYLSVQRIIGSPAVAASFKASYEVPNPNGSPLPVLFGLDSGGNAYPANGIVGAATDYNPLTNSAAQHLTMGWATDGPTTALSVEAVGVGRVEVAANNIPAESGSLALSYVNAEFNAQMTRTAAPTSGSNPRVTITAPVPNTAASTSAVLQWTNLAQNFTFALRPDLVNGRPTGMSFHGSQTMAPNANFAMQVDYVTNNVLSARMQQQRFGTNFSETITTTQDDVGNPTGLTVDGSPGALSTLVITAYASGVPGAVIELVDIPATAAHAEFHMKGTGDASLGATITGSPGPAFVGVISYFTSLLGGAASATPQISFTLNTGASLTAAPPVAITPGVQIAVNVTRVNPNFTIEMESISASNGGTGVNGFRVSGNTTGSKTADQILIDAQAELSTRARVVMNQLGQEFEFKANLHGTTANPTGLDVTDSNVPAMPNEYKQIHMTGIVNGVYQPLYTFAIQRAGSDTSGAVAPAPKNAVIQDPPATFDTSIDYVTNTTGNVCHQTLDIKGSSTSETNGSVILSAGGMGLTAGHVFVTGHWTVHATVTGSAGLDCAPDSFTVHAHQDVGGNPDGSISAFLTGVGRMTLRSFATDTEVKVNIIRDQARVPVGARIDGDNGEANPGMQVALEQQQGGITTTALNLWSGAQGSVVNGTKGTAVVYNVPQVFGISTTLLENSGRRVFKVESYNPQAAPAETMVVTAPAQQLAPGGTIRFVLRSFDTHTEVHVTAPTSLSTGAFETKIHNSNVNANLTEAIGIDVRDSGGTPVLAAALSRPNGDVSSFPTSALNGAFRWSNMPQTADITITANLPPSDTTAYSGGMKVDVQNAVETPSSSMIFTQPLQRAMLSVQGVGAAQNMEIHFDRNLNEGSGDLHVFGSMPAGFQNVQLESLWGGIRDATVSVYRSGPWLASGNTTGTNVYITPASSQRAYDFHATLKADEATLENTADVPGQQQTLAQYFYGNGATGFGRCIWSDIAYPCTRINMYSMPQHSSLHMVSPSPNCSKAPGVPHIDYAATDSNLDLTVDSLIECLGGGMAFYGLPAHGITMEGTLGNFCDSGPALTMKVTPGFGEVMPYTYIDGWNIHMPVTCVRDMALAGDPLPPTVQVSGVLQAQLNYVGGIQVQMDGGLTEVKVEPVPSKEGKYLGLEGVMAKGNPNARFVIGLGFGLGPFVDQAGNLVPSSMDWQWEATALGGTFLADSDYDHFEWPETDVNYADGWISSYAWEAFPNNTNRYQFDPWTCAPGSIVNYHAMLSYSPEIPFQPGFTKVNNGLTICGGKVAYFQLVPQNLAFRHCSEMTLWNCPAGGSNYGATNEWSYADVQVMGYYSDWVLAAAMKALYNQDPLALTTQLGTP